MKRGGGAAQPNSPLEPTGSTLVAHRERKSSNEYSWTDEDVAEQAGAADAGAEPNGKREPARCGARG